MNATRALAIGGALCLLTSCQQAPTGATANTSAKPAPKSAAPTAAAPSEESLNTDTVVASWTIGGETKSLTYGQIKGERKAAFLKIERDRYNAVRREVEGYVLDQLMEAEAKKAGKKDTNEFLKGLADAVPAEEVKKFYDAQVGKGGKGPPMDAVEGQIRQYISMKGVVDRIKKDAGMKITIPEPETPKAEFQLADRPRKGPEDAKVTIVEFSDFECPYCARATAPIEAIVKEFPKQVKVYFLHFPLSFHQKAMPAAVAARCAQKQGKFWEMHDKIFADQSKLADDDLKGYAKALGFDMKAYGACIEDPATKAFVMSDMKQGSEAGVGGTPSFYVNGKQHSGPPSVADIRAIVEG